MKHFLAILFIFNVSFIIAQIEVSYGNDSLQKLDYYSATNPNSPIVIIVHGGGWYTGNKTGPPYQNAAQLFQLKGYAVININYRLVPNNYYPSQIEDLACALVWAKSNAVLFNGDSSRVVIYGHSAGGQMAAYLGERPINAMLNGCISTAGLNVDGVILTSATVDFDLTNIANWPPILSMLNDSVQFWNIAQPSHHCANNFDTKFLIICGQNDVLGIKQDSIFNDSLIYYSHCSKLKTFFNHDHNSLLDNLSETSLVFISMTDFLDSLWLGSFCPTTAIEFENKPKSLFLYPNPFTSNTTFIFENSNKENYTLLLYNVYGKVVQEINNITTDKVNINRENLTNGLYFFKLFTSSKNIVTGKLIAE